MKKFLYVHFDLVTCSKEKKEEKVSVLKISRYI